MNIWKKIDKLNSVLEKIQDFFDDSPIYLNLSRDMVLRQKVKNCLSKYALYDEVNIIDSVFNNIGCIQIEFVGRESELSLFQIVIEKVIFDYLKSGSLDYTRTKSSTHKVSENIYVVNIYYSFNKKTLKNFELYFSQVSNYKKQELLKNETIIDNDLEREMEEWKIT